MMKFQKRYNTFTRIKNNYNNTRKLYKIISNLTGQDKTNPLSEAHSDQELAEHFAEFFLQNIETICKNAMILHHTQQYQLMCCNSLNAHPLMNQAYFK